MVWIQGGMFEIGSTAGAMSIGTLLAMPRAVGLFRRAIVQSGAAHHVIPAETARRIGTCLAEKLGVQPTREAVAAVPVDRLLAAQVELKAELLARPDPARWGRQVVSSMMPWQPVIDGEVLPARPIDRIAAGAGAQVDILVGTNTDDWRLFLVITGAISQITDEILTGPVEAFGYRSLAAYDLPVDRALAAYRARNPDAGPGDLLAAVQTDWWVRNPRHAPGRRSRERRRRHLHVRVRMGRAWPRRRARAGGPVRLRRPQQGRPLFGPLLGDNPPQEIADTMHPAWVSFARDGDPGWPEYEPSRRATMRFDTTSQVVDDPRAWERSLWEGVR